MLHYLLIMFMVYFASVESKTLRSNEDSCPGVYSCANCTAVRLCNPVLGSGYIEYQTANCTGNTPYCDSATGTCVSSPSSECATTDEFTCLKDGSFPHPTACNKYYQCQNLQSHSYTCVQSYYYYDSVSESCIYNKGCYRFSCTGYNGYKTPYPKDPSIYAYCVNGVATLVDRCFGKYELNVTSQLCQPVCKHEGLIPNEDDCTTYYRCDPVPYVSDQYVMSLAKCPKGEAYSPNDFQCLPTASVPWCKVPATTTATPE